MSVWRIVPIVLAMWAGDAMSNPYPEPPQQKVAWTSTSKAKFADVAKGLFDLGVADPRGCEYRAIEIDVTEGMDDAAKKIATHGWVIPGNTHAVAWNGLVYKVRSVGAAASVTADIKAILDATRKAPSYSYAMAEEEHYVAFATPTPTKALLLLRLGEATLAASMWAAAVEPHQDARKVLVDDWLWAQFVRGVGAHRRGDVELAIESWRRLPALATGVPFLADISALLADATRRASHPAAPIDLVAIRALAPAQRIAKLVAALDQVVNTGFGGPDPIVEALVAEGAAAIEPVLVAYETDDRFTRSRFVDIRHGDSGRWRHVIPVFELAQTVIARLVDLSSFASATQITARKAYAAELRAYIKQWSGVSVGERHFRVLADDTRDESQWLGAATQITQPAVAATLRGKTNPTVTALFEKRLRGFDDLRMRAQMLQAFATWDPKAAMPHLARTVRTGFASWASGEHRGMDPYLGEALVGLVTTRIAGGDTTALGEYADWIVTTVPEHAQFASLRWFAPMIANPHAPEVTRASKALFESSTSPWIPLTAKRAGFYSIELLGSALVQVPAFRAHVLVGLANKAKLGTITMQANSVNVVTDAFQQGEGVDAKDPLLPKSGWTDTLRVADQYAASFVSGRTGAPLFRRYWPVAARDKAIAAIVAWLKAQP